MAMSDLGNLVDENHYIGLQSFCGEGEITDVAKGKDCVDLLSWYHGVELAAIGQAFGNDLRASRSESNLEKLTHLVDGHLEHVRFARHLLPLFLHLFQMQQWVLAQLRDLVFHVLDWADHNLGVRGDEERR